ncbi:hypothetical protein [Mucilaginibacter sp.]|uniref:hypothetical protein n=1 Tax=Mucilaginibacter sp. TaxID=1882438 RepID=UPI0032668DDC
MAIRRFSEEQKGWGIFRNSSPKRYPDIVKTFVTSGNCINCYDIARVEKSRFAIPERLMRQIEGETTMGWTGFAAKMKDGKCFGFGTNFRFEFFDLPDGYNMADVEEIISHSYVLDTGEVCSHQIAFSKHPQNYDKAVIYREKVFFECFLNGLK